MPAIAPSSTVAPRQPGRGLASVSILLGILLLPSLSGCRSPTMDNNGEAPFSVVTHGDWADVKRLSDRVAKIFTLYSSLFGVEAGEMDFLSVKVKQNPTFVGVPGEDEYPALFRLDPPRIEFNTQPDLGLLLHEMAHHFIVESFGGLPPPWLNEGLASYLGWSAVGEDAMIPGEIAVEHLKSVKRAALEGGLIPLRDFLDLGPAAFYERGSRDLHYSQAWAFIYFLLHRVADRGDAAQARISALESISRKELLAMEPDFLAFCRGFSALDTLMEGLGSRDVIRSRSAAFRLGLLQDKGAMKELLHLARDPTRLPEEREVALLAAGMILLGPDGKSVTESFFKSLEALEKESNDLVRSAAVDLRGAVRERDASVIQKRYGAVGCDTDFYPAGRFKIRHQ